MVGVINVPKTLILLVLLVTLKATGVATVTIIEPVEFEPTVVYTADGPTLQVVF